MPTGTKVILAVLGLLVGVLVVYYGFMLPDATLAALDEPEAITQTSETTGNEAAGSVARLSGGMQTSNPSSNDDSRSTPGLLTSAVDKISEMMQGNSATPPVVIARDSLRPPEVSQPTSSGLSGGFADQGNAFSSPKT